MGYSKGFLKLKKEIKELTDYGRGFYAKFWIGYIHGIHDFDKYGRITEEEGKKLEDMFKVKGK